MDFFFKPDGIAVLGATINPGKGGFHILDNVVSGYNGRVFPVNPKYQTILEHTCYPDLQSIPENFDLVIYFIPARFLPDTIKICAEKKVKGIIIESAGFAEASENGMQLQRECVALAKENNIRLWGPNCMGLIDSHLRHVFSFMYWDAWKEIMKPGNISLIVQSGMLSAGFLMMILERGGIEISKVCSIGNKCDVNESDLLEYLILDPDTDVIGMYLESIVDGRRFMELAKSTKKPIVILKGGRNRYGAGAAISHTASLAGDNNIIQSAFRQAGIISVYDAHELMDFLSGFAKVKEYKPDGGTAILTFSGGGGIITADFLEDFGLNLAKLNNKTLSMIQDVFPVWMKPSNPVDIWPAIELNGPKKVLPATLLALMNDSGVDSIIVHFFGLTVDKEQLTGLVRLREEFKKPVIVWLVGFGEAYGEMKKEFNAFDLPVFTEMGRCVSVLGALKRHYSKKGSVE